MKTVTYYMSPSSPWTYLGHNRLAEIAKSHGASIIIKPYDLSRIFPLSGGLPLPKRAPQRQAYRLAELKRWRDHLNVPLTIQPKYFPVPADQAMIMICGAITQLGQEQGFALAGAIMKGCWADEQNIDDVPTLHSIANAMGMDGAALMSDPEAMTAMINEHTDEGIELQAFGSPWYRVGEHQFWGQDRLEFVDRALADLDG
jgi:2-hydroxychromene-2-carboxylate isomerase